MEVSILFDAVEYEVKKDSAPNMSIPITTMLYDNAQKMIEEINRTLTRANLAVVMFYCVDRNHCKIKECIKVSKCSGGYLWIDYDSSSEITKDILYDLLAMISVKAKGEVAIW